MARAMWWSAAGTDRHTRIREVLANCAGTGTHSRGNVLERVSRDVEEHSGHRLLFVEGPNAVSVGGGAGSATGPALDAQPFHVLSDVVVAGVEVAGDRGD